jgi:hypothetical protein
MQPGEWVARCVRGEINVRGNKISAVLSFSVLGRFTETGFTQENAGVVLKQWYFLSKKTPEEDEIILEIQPHSKYGVAWALAMGRQLKANENPDPKAFEKKIFRVDVGFSSAAGGSFSYRNVGRKKEPRDFLRIHSIVEKMEQKALSHMTPYEPIGGHVHEHVNGHEHDTRALTSTSAPASTLTETSAVAESESKVVRIGGASDMGNEREPQGHANEAPGVSSEKKSITVGDVLRTFPGANITRKSVTEQFQLYKARGTR